MDDYFRYWIFAGDVYYPRGGMYDLRKKIGTLEEARAWLQGFLEDESLTWGHIYDSVTENIYTVTEE